MIVYTYGRAWGTADLSPFCVKLETWLRMAGLPYEQRIGNVRKTPNRKLPAVNIDGQVIADSALIIEHLRAQHGDPLGDDTLSVKERAEARALRALVESELYFAALYFRWSSDEGWRVCQPEIVRYMRTIGVPGWLAPSLSGSARRRVRHQLNAQGMGRHGAAEIAAIGIGGLNAIGDYLAEKPFILGAVPHTLDATVFGFLHALLLPPFEYPLKDALRERANLLAYHDRMMARFWPELSLAEEAPIAA